MKQTTRDALLIEMARLLLGIALCGTGHYDKFSGGRFRKIFIQAMRETEEDVTNEQT